MCCGPTNLESKYRVSRQRNDRQLGFEKVEQSISGHIEFRILIKDNRHHQHFVKSFRIVVIGRVFLETMIISIRFRFDMLCPIIERGQIFIHVQIFCAGQTFGTEQIQPGDVAVLKFSG